MNSFTKLCRTRYIARQEGALRLEMVRTMREANVTTAEIVGAFEDAWILDDERWVVAAGGADELRKRLTMGEDGRVLELDLPSVKTLVELPPVPCCRRASSKSCTRSG